MLKQVIFLFSLLLFFFSGAQVINKTDSNRVKTTDSVVVDSGTTDSLKIFKPTIQDYQFYTQFSERKILDTSLTYEKTWVYSQYNNRDNFGKHQFANIGSGFNPLMYELNSETNLSLLPTNKSFGILGINDIKYYDVKTPTAIFIYHNAARNGAALQSTYTQNIGKNFNFAIEYMGLRSQGFYRNSLASNNNTHFSSHYRSKNQRYEIFAHYLHQNVNNQEYGGIANDELFLAGEDSYNSRPNIEVNLAGSNSQFGYRRYYLSHQFTPFNSEKFPFRVRHTLFHQGNKYYYHQANPEPYYYNTAAELVSYLPSSMKFSKNLSNTFSLVLDNDKFKLDAGVRHQLLSVGVEHGLTANGVEIPEKVKENRLGAVGNLQIKLWDKFDLNSSLEYSNGKSFGNFLRSANNVRFEPLEGYFVNAKVNFQSAFPSFNYLLNSSVYRRFNYFEPDLKNQSVMEIGGNVNLKWFQSQLLANYFRIENFTYFGADAQPRQSDSSVNISQIGGEATFTFGKFNLNTRLQFQNTLTNKDLFPAPAFIGRANLFYQTKAFKRAAEIQTGLKTYYFSKFSSRDYFPVLNEFILPDSNSFSIGGTPVVDLYFNLKVKRMFFYIEGQHMNTLISENKLYAVPHYPFYDFRLNIGIVWYLIN